MPNSKYTLYSCAANGSQWFQITAVPEVDRAFWAKSRIQAIAPLTYPLPLYVADALARRLTRWTASTRVHQGRWQRRVAQYRIRQEIRSALRSRGLPARFVGQPLSWETDATELWPWDRSLLSQRLFALLQGRALFVTEMERAVAAGIGLPPGMLESLQILVLQGLVERLPAVSYDGMGRFHCQRCGERSEIVESPCPYCGERLCPSCPTCLPLGEARGCREVFRAKGAANPVTNRMPVVTPHRVWNLTRAQQDAAENLLQAVKEGHKGGGGRALLWAACGAGKTEIVYGIIAWMLNRNQKILFAVPRRDVVVELAQRLRLAFPSISVKALYGGADRPLDTADLYVATTHQTMRFYRAFELVILDEVDAFPYRGSSMLHRAVERARTDNGTMVYMTATPSPDMRHRVKQGDLACVMLPSRHHGRPLPVPRVVVHRAVTAFLTAGDELPRFIQTAVESLLEDTKTKPLLVFVPYVDMVRRVVTALQGTWPRLGVDGIHGGEAQRDAILDRFRQHGIDVLVATSVAERGITVPGVQVLVLGADVENIFDTASLVQMAGRADRTVSCPGGEVLFLAGRQTGNITGAVEDILQMNEAAEAMGYLMQEASDHDQSALDRA